MRGVAVIVLSLALVACPKELTLVSTGEASESSGTSGTSTGPAVPTTSMASSGGEPSSGGSTGLDLTTTSTTGGSTGAAESTSSGAAETTGETTAGSSGGESSTTEALGHPFDCYGCLCDAQEVYCQQVFGGLTARASLPLPPELCPLVEPDSVDSGCVLFPAVCGDTPSCDCLPTKNQQCYCTEVDPGVFEVICQLP